MPDAKLPPGSAGPGGHTGHGWTGALAAVMIVATAGVVPAQVAPKDSAWLVTTTQSLLDAVTTGDSSVWSPVLAADWSVSDEEGGVTGRAEFLAGLRPLPSGQTGRLTLTRPRLAARPGVAVLSYDAEELHDYHGQLLRTRFRVTDTWIRQGGRWQQIASQVTALPWPAIGQRVPAALAREYAGTYALTPTLRLTVVASDGGLAMKRDGQETEALHALDDLLFIRHGARGFWVFERDSSGTVSALVSWRDNNRVVWQKVR
jgi:hypothetical protein